MTSLAYWIQKKGFRNGEDRFARLQVSGIMTTIEFADRLGHGIN